MLGRVGLAEEELVDLLLEALGEDEPEGKEEAHDQEDGNDIHHTPVRSVVEKFAERGDQPHGQGDPDDPVRLAGKEVFGALANENTEIHRALNDDDVGERKRKQKKDGKDGNGDPLRNALANVCLMNGGEHGQNKERGETNAGADVEDAKTTAGVAGDSSQLEAEIHKEVTDRQGAEEGFNVVNGKKVWGKWVFGGEIVGVTNEKVGGFLA